MIRLKDVRNKFKMQQKDVCLSLNIPQNTYSQYENGKREPDSETLSRIADFFNVSVDYLLGRTDEPSVKSLDEQLEGIDFALWGEVRDLTDEEKQDIINFAKFTKSIRKN